MPTARRERLPNYRRLTARALLVPALLGLLTLPAVELDGGPSVDPRGVTIHDRAKAYRGFNLFVDISRPPAEGQVVLASMDGATVHAWPSPFPRTPLASFAEPLVSGNVLAVFRGDDQTETVLVELDWSGAVVWRWDPPRGAWIHHDVERLPDGDTLLLLSRYETDPTIAPNRLINPLVVEIDPEGELVWEWSTIAHWSDLPLDDAQRQALWRHNEEGSSVVFQTNSVTSLPPNPHEASDPRFLSGNLLMSQRDTDLVTIIDRESGRIVWSMQQTIGQHQASMIETGLPGAGNLLLLDNGGESLYGSSVRRWSRVLEIDPVTMRTVWEYDSEQGPSAFFSRYQGGAQRLSNGNTLIVEASRRRAFEVTTTGEIVWEQILAMPSLYRMTRVGPDWPAVARGAAAEPANGAPSSIPERSEPDRRP